MGWLDEARSALDGVQDQPARSMERARRVLAAEDGPAGARVLARWALGRALQELGDPRQGADELTAAAAAAAASGDSETQGHIDMSLAWALMAAGDTDGALAAIDRADAVLTGTARARVGMQRGLLNFQLGRLDAALASFDAALPALRRAGDRVAVARLLVNRAAASTAMGRWSGARADLVEAASTAQDAGLGLVAAGAEHNLGYLCGRQGDVPRALDHFSRAADAYAGLDGSTRLRAVLGVDRCEVLLAAGLTEEARREAHLAVRGFTAAEATSDAHEATLLLARAELAAGDTAAARATAATAEAGFAAAGRHAWGALAAYTGLLAEVAATEDEARPPADMPERIAGVATRLEDAGWSTEAAHARTFLGRTALALGRLDQARRVLAHRRLHPAADAGLRVQVWHGRALLRLAEGDRKGATRALRQGFAVVDAHRHTLGATELRASASALGSELARLELRIAFDAGRPSAVLRASERHRAAALQVPPVRPPDDTDLSDAMAALRVAESDRRAALLDGPPGSGPPTEVAARVFAAERRVRDITRRSRGADGASTSPPSASPSVASLRAALGDRTLVSYVALDHRLHAVVIAPNGARLVALGDTAAAEAERNHLLSALRRGLQAMLRVGRDGERAVDAIERAAARLDQLLLAPLQLGAAGTPAGPDVVIVPTSFLHSLPWGALPSLRGGAVTVSPSAALWHRSGASATPPRPPRAPLLVAGPDLDGAGAELDDIARLWPDARRLDGQRATVDAVLDALGDAGLVHISAHGTFRADSPLFSSLRLADGVLTVYDLEGLDHTPDIVVLPACNAAALDVRSGDELLGTTAALLGTGVTSVVAPVVAIPDRTAAAYTVALHRSLCAGRPVGRAAAAAAAELRAVGDPLSVLTATTFVCVGGDDRPVDRAPRA